MFFCTLDMIGKDSSCLALDWAGRNSNTCTMDLVGKDFSCLALDWAGGNFTTCGLTSFPCTLDSPVLSSTIFLLKLFFLSLCW